MTRLYAIGDIHGQKSMLEEQLALIDKDGGTAAPVVFLGDYVDRGPDSKGVIDLFLQGLAEGRDWIFLKGNHDRLFERFLDTGQTHDDMILSGKRWLHPNLGGLATLGSYIDLDAALSGASASPDQLTRYGFDPLPEALASPLLDALNAAIPPAHRAFLDGLQLYHEVDGYVFVHAGVRPGLPLAYQSEQDLLWIRDEFLEDQRDHGAFVVHGHTSVEAPDMRLNRLNLDTGAGYGRRLSTAVFEDGAVYHLNAMGRARL
ncbi:metallophosphoesterase [Primorskyibacter sp. 2E107]|uniref:metallophosphoesterase n=1 Tax=Primorskyibacter sp. 2E107 TaxID=3403458 RepID=UPI003AF7B67C